MERLRTALNWELAPVIADFSPAFNAEAPTIFDKASSVEVERKRRHTPWAWIEGASWVLSQFKRPFFCRRLRLVACYACTLGPPGQAPSSLPHAWG